jgi:hypothetical protein
VQMAIECSSLILILAGSVATTFSRVHSNFRRLGPLGRAVRYERHGAKTGPDTSDHPRLAPGRLSPVRERGYQLV